MDKFNLWENLQPITLEELTKEKKCDTDMFNLLKSVASKHPTISDFLDVKSTKLEDIRKLYFHLYKISSLQNKKETDYINSLPPDEKELLENLRNIMRNLSIINESNHIKVEIGQVGKNSSCSSIFNTF